MKKGVFTLMLLAVAGASRAGEESIARYDIVAKGLTIGKAETIRSHVRRDGMEFVRFQVTSKVDVDLLFVSCHLEGVEDVLLGPDGIVQFAISGTKDGHAHETAGGLTNGIFYCYSVFDGVTNQLEVPRSSFSATTLDGLEMRLEKDSPAVTNRVFDCAQVKAFDRMYRWSGDEELKVGTTNKTFRIVEFEDAQKKGRRWVGEDAWGMFIGRQEAKESSGSYVLKLREYFTRPLATAAASRRDVSKR